MKHFHRDLQISAFAACLVLFGGACSNDTTTSEATPQNAIAKVGERWVFEHDLTPYLKNGHSNKSALEQFIREESLAQSAIAAGFDNQLEIQAAWRRLLSSRYLELELAAPPQVAEAEVRRSWEEGTQFTEPKQVRIAILRRSITADKDDALAKLQAAIDAYRNASSAGSNTRGFGPVAAKVSDHHDTRYQGGDCGWIREGQSHALLPDAVVEAALTSPSPAVLEELTLADDAAWAILVTDVREAHKRPYEEVAMRIRRELEEIAAEEQRAAFFQELATRIPVKRLSEFPTGQSAVATLVPPSGP